MLNRSACRKFVQNLGDGGVRLVDGGVVVSAG
jgi:hypothetical protein